MFIELGVVKQREQRHDLNVGAIDLGHAKAVLQHPGPMEHTVVRPDRQLPLASVKVQTGVAGVAYLLGALR